MFARIATTKLFQQRPAMLILLTAALSSQAQTTSPPTEAKKEALHVLAQNYQSTGVRKCTDKVDLVSKFLGGQAATGTTVFPIGQRPDESILTVSTEISDGKNFSYAGATYAPHSTGCSAVYEVVSWHPSKCEELSASPAYAAFRNTGSLHQNIKTISNDPTMRIAFMPAGSGCVVIKKNWFRKHDTSFSDVDPAFKQNSSSSFGSSCRDSQS